MNWEWGIEEKSGSEASELTAAQLISLYPNYPHESGSVVASSPVMKR